MHDVGGGADERPSTRRRFLAVAFATVLAVAAYWAIVVSIAAASDTGSVDETTAVAVMVGFVLLPGAFFVLAWLSGRDGILRSGVLASALALVIWTWLPFLVGELLSPFAAALGAGGAFALRLDPPARMAHRLLAALAIAGYVFVVARLAFGFALLATPFLPLLALLWADVVSARIAR